MQSKMTLRLMVALWVLFLCLVFIKDVFAFKNHPLRLSFGRGSFKIYDGQIFRQIDDYFIQNSWLFTKIRPTLTRLAFQYAHQLAGDVLEGKNGWLFDAWSFQNRGREGKIAECSAQKRIRHINSVFNEHHAHLMVVVVPLKIRIYPENLYASGTLPYYLQDNYHLFLDKLGKANVDHVDLERVLLSAKNDLKSGDFLYLPQDHHWSSLGCFRASQAVADSIRQKHPEVCDKNPTMDVHLEERWAPVKQNLLNRLGVTPKMEEVPTLRSIEISGKKSGTKDAQVILAGDSFADGGQMASYIEYFLKSPVMDVSVAGGGASKSMKELCQKNILANPSEKIVIWLCWEYTMIGRDLSEMDEIFAK